MSSATVPLMPSGRASHTASTALGWIESRRWRRGQTTTWTAGRASGIGASTTRWRRVMCPLRWWVTKTWTPTAAGTTTAATVMSGRPLVWPQVGHPTVTATGAGSTLGAGPGLTTHPGAMRSRTMAAGPTWAMPGAGCPGRAASARYTRQPWWSSLAARTSRPRPRWAAAWQMPWAGCRWPRARSTSPRMRSAAATSSASIAAMP